MKTSACVLKDLLRFQKNEITESVVYSRLASIEKNPDNKRVLALISKEEGLHYQILKKHTGKEVKADFRKVFVYYWMARILGVTFTIKLMESDEKSAQTTYNAYQEHDDILRLADDEKVHEEKLIAMINEERLSYMGSIVLGLNDALVEFTGALAGFTLALNDAKLIALTGSITGIAAALSMASSEYLSTKTAETKEKHPVKAAVYTGIAYLITVISLVSPFMWISNVLVALAAMLCIATIIIALFNYYYAVARGESFRSRFTEMAILSFSVAGVSFLIGYLLKMFIGVEV
ncbi:MAG: VIT1/CCC1 transporter family protein [Bacteroidales bacterium]|nr:VIT1/CCC1 transporter family protein [Bacteroidales bacterium]